MKTVLFDKLNDLARRPLLEVHKVARFLSCTDDNVRKQIKGGCYAAIRAGQWKIISESFVYWLISQLWQDSLEGRELPGIDAVELSRWRLNTE